MRRRLTIASSKRSWTASGAKASAELPSNAPVCAKLGSDLRIALSLNFPVMVTRSHLQLVQSAAPAVEALRARLTPTGGVQHELVGRTLDAIEPAYRELTHRPRPSLLALVLEAAATLTDLKLDADAIVAALLYRLHGSSGVEARTVRERFGPAVAELCDGVVRMAEIGALFPRE